MKHSLRVALLALVLVVVSAVSAFAAVAITFTAANGSAAVAGSVALGTATLSTGHTSAVDGGAPVALTVTEAPPGTGTFSVSVGALSDGSHSVVVRVKSSEGEAVGVRSVLVKTGVVVSGGYGWLSDGVASALTVFSAILAKVVASPVLALFVSAAVIFLVIAMVRRLMSA